MRMARLFPAATKEWQSAARGRIGGAMPKVEIRPGVWMAYEDHWFGEPWTVPEIVVMVHGNSKSSRAWTPWVPHLAGKYRVMRPDLPGFGASTEPPDYGWSVGRARGRHRALPRCARDRELPPDRRQVRRLGLHAASPSDQPQRLLLALPVRLAGARQRQRQCRRDPRTRACGNGRPRPCGRGSAARRPRRRSSGGRTSSWARPTPRAAFGASSARIDMELEDGLSRITRTDADRDDAGERAAVGRGGRAICGANSRCARDRAAGRQLSHRGGRAGVCAQHALAFMRGGLRTQRAHGRTPPNDLAFAP